MTKIVNDPNDFAEPVNELEYFRFVANKSDSNSVSDLLMDTPITSPIDSTIVLYRDWSSFGETTIDTGIITINRTWSIGPGNDGGLYENPNVVFGINHSNTETLLMNTPAYPDYITIQMDGDGLRLFDTSNTSDINSIDSSILLDSDTVSNFECVQVYKNAYIENLGNYVLGDWVSTPDATSGNMMITPITVAIAVDDSQNSIGPIDIYLTGVITINNIWTLT